MTSSQSAVDKILFNLKQSLEAAPKSAAGFVHFKRIKGFADTALSAMLAAGIDEVEARRQVYHRCRPYDCVQSKREPTGWLAVDNRSSTLAN